MNAIIASRRGLEAPSAQDFPWLLLIALLLAPNRSRT